MKRRRIQSGLALRLLAAAALILWPDAAVAQDQPAGDRPDSSASVDMAAAVRAAVARVEPLLVRIDTVGGVGSAGLGGRANPTLTDAGRGPTTGLLLGRDGLVVTSTFNLIRNPRVLTVQLPDGSRRVAELLGRDQTRKICLLRVDGYEADAAPDFADPADLAIGQWAISVGLGYDTADPAVSLGIVSALNRAAGRAIQTDANLSPANYGGPVVDLDGRVLGIAVPMNPRQPDDDAAGAMWYDSGIGFAVPLHGLDRVIDRLAEGQTLRHGMLGIRPVADPDRAAVIVETVLGGSPADEAGLLAGDRIIAVDGRAVERVTDLRIALARFNAGDALTLQIRRGERSFERKVTLAAGPFESPSPPEGESELEPEATGPGEPSEPKGAPAEDPDRVD